jgi:hypothetical protein
MTTPAWLRPNYMEPRVLAAVRDFCRYGDTVFDVGANVGGITVAMSRALELRGAVCALEASIAGEVAHRCVLDTSAPSLSNSRTPDSRPVHSCPGKSGGLTALA